MRWFVLDSAPTELVTFFSVFSYKNDPWVAAPNGLASEAALHGVFDSLLGYQVHKPTARFRRLSSG